MTKREAIRRLTNRWNEQVEKYPLMRDDIPLALYLRRNLPHVLNSPLENPLAAYEKG